MEGMNNQMQDIQNFVEEELKSKETTEHQF